MSDENKNIVDKIRNQYETEQTVKQNVLTEIFDLPSKGYFYPEEHPLSSGQIEIKYPTAKEEDILTSKSLIQKGLVLDKFMQSILITDVDYNTLLLGDKNGIMIASRILAYGDEYTVDYNCPKCSTENKNIAVDLSEIKTKEIEFEKYPKGTSEFYYELKDKKDNVIHKIKFRILTHEDSNKIDEELKAMKKKLLLKEDREMTTRLKYAITEVDGKRDNITISNFVDNLLTRFSLQLRKAIQKVTPDIELEFYFECNECGHTEMVPIPIEANFFWPSGRL